MKSKQLTISRVVYLSSLSFISKTFKILAFPFKVTGQPDFVFQSEISFSTYELFYKILIRPIKLKKIYVAE